MYEMTLQIVGELSTLTATSRRPPKFPAYQHELLRQTFDPVMNALRACLAVQLGDNVISIPLVQKKFWHICVGTIADKEPDRYRDLRARRARAGMSRPRISGAAFPHNAKSAPLKRSGTW